MGDHDTYCKVDVPSYVMVKVKTELRWQSGAGNVTA